MRWVRAGQVSGALGAVGVGERLLALATLLPLDWEQLILGATRLILQFTQNEATGILEPHTL